MSHARFHRRSEWRIEASRRAVYETLVDLARVSSWWPDFDRVRVLSGDRIRARVQGPIGSHFDLELEITEAAPPERIVLEVDGDLRGRGVFSLVARGAGTDVVYDWDVRIERPWLARLSPLLGPIFRRSHDAVMRTGERGLRSALRGHGTQPRSLQPE